MHCCSPNRHLFASGCMPPTGCCAWLPTLVLPCSMPTTILWKMDRLSGILSSTIKKGVSATTSTSVRCYSSAPQCFTTMLRKSDYPTINLPVFTTSVCLSVAKGASVTLMNIFIPRKSLIFVPVAKSNSTTSIPATERCRWRWKMPPPIICGSWVQSSTPQHTSHPISQNKNLLLKHRW